MTNNSQNVCSNCGEHNPLYLKNCEKCKHYLRSTVVNIDLWSTFWKLFENPREGLKNVIFAEHKNFLSFLIVFLGTKLFISATFIQSLLGHSLPNSQHPFYNFLIIFALLIPLSTLYCSLTRFIQ